MNITVRINGHERGAPGGRAIVDILVEPTSTGPHDRRPAHRIVVDTDGPLCDVKNLLFETVQLLVRDELAGAPKMPYPVTEGASIGRNLADAPAPAAPYATYRDR